MAKISSTSTQVVTNSSTSTVLSFGSYDSSTDTDLTTQGINIEAMSTDSQGNISYSSSTPNVTSVSVVQYTDGMEVSYTITDSGMYRITMDYSYCEDGNCSDGSGDPHIRTLDGQEYML